MTRSCSSYSVAVASIPIGARAGGGAGGNAEQVLRLEPGRLEAATVIYVTSVLPKVCAGPAIYGTMML